MKCYKLLIDASITIRNNTKKSILSLHKGDFIFKNENPVYILSAIDIYNEYSVLNSIYYKKYFLIKDIYGNLETDYTWEYIKDINIISPTININDDTYSFNHSDKLIENKFIKDYTIEWNRKERLNTLLHTQK